MDLQLLRPSWADRFPQLVVGQSTRAGGVSLPPFDSLNLGLHTQDDAAAVEENRRRLATSFGFRPEQLSGGHQIHSDQLACLETPGQYDGCDAFMTDRQDILLSVTVADCVPVLIVDPTRQLIAAAHAGWKGTAARIAYKTVARLEQQYGSAPQDCWAFIGASIGFDDFEVGPEVGIQFAEHLRRGPDSRGKYFVDLKGANREQLIAAGLLAEQIDISPVSSLSQPELVFSHRASGDGRTGRGLAIIGYRNS